MRKSNSGGNHETLNQAIRDFSYGFHNNSAYDDVSMCRPGQERKDRYHSYLYRRG
jgi:hypothetical protein